LTKEYHFAKDERLRLDIKVPSVDVRINWDGNLKRPRLEIPTHVIPLWSLAIFPAAPLMVYMTSWVMKRRRIVYRLVSLTLAICVAVGFSAVNVISVSAAPDIFYLRTTPLNGEREMTRGTAGTTGTTLAFNATQTRIWYSSETYPTGGDDASIPSGAYTFTMDYKRASKGSTITFTAEVGLSNADGSSYSQFGISSPQTTIDGGGTITIVVPICVTCAAQTITASAPKKLVYKINVTGVVNTGINMRYDGGAGTQFDSRLDTPTVVVPEAAVALIPVVVGVPTLVGMLKRRKRKRINS
jgi:hypothetical protein